MRFLFLLAALFAAANAANYAVLIAGSNGYYNYRHQADVCHAYQLLTQKGHFPAENIITFMYDDIANNPSNPVPGNIINRPNGTNVYAGVAKDYTGAQVTATNFLNVLKGNAAAMAGIGSGRVLKSGPTDNVFIYYSDHGATGLVAMPSGPYLYAKDLQAALQYMHDNKMYKELVFYLEACESGSMFSSSLPNNINVYATTAANPTESSYAYYYDSQRGTYLGDEYSVKWMENSDAVSFKSETLEQQFQVVKNATQGSHVCEYGQLSIANEDIGQFQSYMEQSNRLMIQEPYFGPAERASSRDVKLDILRRHAEHYAAQNDIKAMQFQSLYEAELAERDRADRAMRGVVSKLVSNADAIFGVRAEINNWDCYKGAIDAFENKCGRFTDYSLKWAYALANLCEAHVSLSSISSAVRTVCPVA